VTSGAPIRVGIIGAGFVAPHHVDAVRRLGFADVVAIAASSDESARAKAAALAIPRAYGRYQDLVADRDIQVVHVAAPNHLHAPMISAAIAHGKHVVSDKPLATSAADAEALLEQASRAGVVHVVTFNYRGNSLVQQARAAIARGDVGVPHFIHGQYLQDWLLTSTDYSWRLDPRIGGPSSAMADIGSHWCDLAEHVTGLRIIELLAETTTVVRQRRRPAGARRAFETAAADAEETIDIDLEDLASILLRFDNGARGTLMVGQVCAGHKNDLVLEVCGGTGSMRWRQEAQNELWIGRRGAPNQLLQKDPSLLNPAAAAYARLPAGHHEGWSDAFFNVIRDAYEFIAAGRRMTDPLPPALATFGDGCRAARIVDAALRSAKAGGRWTSV
jgi:predicted dehydrogenase